MSVNLYEILGVQADATPEQIRKAYKKRALQTHPDRAPASDKTQAEEKFRQVNNAYEVLIDSQKRQSYDRHGTWPPPAEDSPRHTQNNTRSHPFHSNVFTFTDPFEVFNSFFGHTSPLHDSFLFGPSRTVPDPFFAPPSVAFSSSPFGPFGSFNSGVGIGGGPFHGVFTHDPFMAHPLVMGGDFFQSQGVGGGGRSASYLPSTPPFSSHQGAGGGQWVSESQSISTINGLTTSVRERVDSSGNRHTTITHPDGHKTYTINGVPGQIDAPLSPLPLHTVPHSHAYHPDPTELHHHHRHYRHHRDHPRGRYDHRGPYRDYDRDYSPNRRDPRRPST